MGDLVDATAGDEEAVVDAGGADELIAAIAAAQRAGEPWFELVVDLQDDVARQIPKMLAAGVSEACERATSTNVVAGSAAQASVASAIHPLTFCMFGASKRRVR